MELKYLSRKHANLIKKLGINEEDTRFLLEVYDLCSAPPSCLDNRTKEDLIASVPQLAALIVFAVAINHRGFTVKDYRSLKNSDEEHQFIVSLQNFLNGLVGINLDGDLTKWLNK